MHTDQALFSPGNLPFPGPKIRSLRFFWYKNNISPYQQGFNLLIVLVSYNIYQKSSEVAQLWSHPKEREFKYPFEV
jgi:hypothetical protein